MSPDEFKDYLRHRYSNKLDSVDIDTMTIEDELKSITIREPFGFPYVNEKGEQIVYRFRYIRIGDVIEGQKLSQNKYKNELKKIQRLPKPKEFSMVDWKEEKQNRLNKVNKKIVKETLLYSRALSMLTETKDGVTRELKPSEKLKVWASLPPSVSEDIQEFLKVSRFGLNSEKEFSCPQCGNTTRRLLRHELSPLEFLPVRHRIFIDC
jgi:TusA-related sulfurtransferase